MDTDLRLHNTLSGEAERFRPADPSRVTMYVCGPTVYGPAHVGNARPAVVFDLLYRLLKKRHPRVFYARNITDIDDKIIQAATEEGVAAAVIAARWETAYLGQMSRLGVRPPDAQPRATEHIGGMVKMIAKLIDKKHAYLAAGHVLFHVPSFADYGALSNRNRGQMMDGARVEVAAHKKDAADFVLWKPSAAAAPGWDSPWGRGRPGWHIECSAMAAACLGRQIDIHGGGQDLIFPHHENEIAQSRCAHGGAYFARYWLHNGHVNLEGEKMSKSLGNVNLLQDALAGFPAEAVRYALLSAHYRRPLNWGGRLLSESRAALDSLYRAAGDGDNSPDSHDSDILPAVESALAGDLNTPAAFAALHSAGGEINRAAEGPARENLRRRLRASARLMGFLEQSRESWFQQSGDVADEKIIADKIQRRREARVRGDFQAADEIRGQLESAGIVLEDSPAGTTWRAK